MTFGPTPAVERSALTTNFDFAALSRWPYPQSSELQAHDAADLLLLDTAQAWWDSGHGASDDGGPGATVVGLEDRHGALALPLLAAGHPVRVGQDALGRERSLDANLARLHPQGHPRLHRGAIDGDLLAGARTVLLQLPRSLDALDQWAHVVAEHADHDVVLLAGGRDKHMTPRQNAVLERYFSSVVPGRGRSKSRVITAQGPKRGQPARFPRTAVHELPDVGQVTLAAFGATFGGANVDPGTRFLLEHVGRVWTPSGDPSREGDDPSPPGRAVDVGCGNGTVAAYLALRFAREGSAAVAGPMVVATDDSADACAATQLTAQLNSVENLIEVRRDDALASFPEASEDTLILNPPFHSGNSVDSRVAMRLFAESARVLRPGGELWCVWNSHLMYRHDLENLVGPTRQIGRDRTFTVTVSTRR